MNKILSLALGIIFSVALLAVLINIINDNEYVIEESFTTSGVTGNFTASQNDIFTINNLSNVTIIIDDVIHVEDGVCAIPHCVYYFGDPVFIFEYRGAFGEALETSFEIMTFEEVGSSYLSYVDYNNPSEVTFQFTFETETLPLITMLPILAIILIIFATTIYFRKEC